MDAWLSDLPADVREEALFVLECGPEAAALLSASTLRVRVGEIASPSWTAPAPTLPVDSALRLLRSPLKLVVENRRNDGAFLKKMAPPDWRGPLLDALARGWIEIEQGGGIEELRLRVEESSRDPVAHLRLWVMFDSDAREPGKPSEPSTRARAACEGITTPRRLAPQQLARRAIENYLPRKPMQGWIDWSPAERAPRRTRVDAFWALRPEQRHHFNMKAGLLGDMPKARREHYRSHPLADLSDADLLPLFHGLGREARRALADGFGATLRDLFHDLEGVEHVREEDMQREVPADERTALLQSVFERQ